nr:putative reverse transcriptase domain-containing protein [Tanacetum cinerariifolium]
MRSTGIKCYIDPISGYKIWRTNRKCHIPIDLYPCKVEERMTMKKVGDQTIGVIQRRRIDKEGNISRFQEYHTSDEEKEELSNMNGWLTDDVNDSDLESTASNQPMSMTMEDTAKGRDAANAMARDDFKALLTTKFCPSNEIKKLEGEFWNHSMVGVDHAGYTDRFHELAKLVPYLIRGMLRATQPATIQADILTVGILIDETVLRSGTLAKAGKKGKKGIRPGHIARDCRTSVRHAEPIREIRPRDRQRASYECESLDHLSPNYLKLDRGRNQSGNQIALEGNRNTQGNENRARGRAFKLNIVDALQDPNVVMGTYSLNNLYATVLFNSGVDFSFISTKFAPLLNEKPSITDPWYVIEVANGNKEEVDRIFRGCRLELGDFIFPIDLIPLGQGSFDVIVGMDWLSNQKDVIVCHEKIVRIPVKGGKVLCVQGERNVGKTKTLISTKENEPKLSDIPIPRDFKDVFLNDLSGLPPQRQTKEDHENHLRLMLNLLRKEKLYEKFFKCKFWLQENQKYEWGKKQDEAFQTLKDNLNKVIAYASRQLKIHEKNYMTHDLELGAVVFALKIWRHYLYETKSVIYTYHKSLQHIFDQKELNMRQKRWLELFHDDECEIKYHPGKANVVSDALTQGEAFKDKNVIAEGLNERTRCTMIFETCIGGREKIAMDFITKFPRSSSGHDAIWVIVDRLTKSAYFLAIREDYSMEKLARLYINEIVVRHGVPTSIISNMDGCFTSRFWQTMQKALGTRLDMTEFSYNNNYHSSIRCALFEAFYERKCRSFVLWAEIGDSRLIRLELVQETTNKVVVIRDRLKAARDRVVQFRKKGKLALRFIRPFEILEMISHVAYRLRLPKELSSVHDTFHVLNLKKRLADANLPYLEIKVDKTLRFVEVPLEIMDR